MDLKQIKELMAAMRRAGLKRISLKEKTGFEIELECFDERPIASSHTEHMIPSGFREYHPPLTTQTVHAPIGTPMSHHHASHAGNKEEEGKFITAPMVGTYYSTPTPEKPAYVKVGDKVDAHTVVCIIEAMKVMNEVKAGISGTVVEVLHSNGQPVEFGSKLFKIV